jgi:hypothetical protein
MRRWLLASPNKIILDFACAGYQLFIIIFCTIYVIPYMNRQKTYQTLYHFLLCGVSRKDFMYGVYAGFLSSIITSACLVYGAINCIYWWETSETCLFSMLSIGSITITGIAYITAGFFFSLLTNNVGIAIVCFLSFYCTSYAINSWWYFVQHQLTGISYCLGSICYFLIPDAQLFNIKQAAFYSLPISYSSLAIQTVYALSWSLFILQASKLIFIYKKKI